MKFGYLKTMLSTTFLFERSSVTYVTEWLLVVIKYKYGHLLTSEQQISCKALYSASVYVAS
jgi:hypothetical protein